MLTPALSDESHERASHAAATEEEFTAAPFSAREIQRAVAEHFGCTLADVLSPRRCKRIALARNAAMWLSRAATGRSYPHLGRLFGRDHTTVLSACRRIDALMACDPAFDAEMRALRVVVLKPVGGLS